MSITNEKNFEFDGVKFKLLSPSLIIFKNNFYKTLYIKLYEEIINGKSSPHINCDKLAFDVCGYDYYELGLDQGLRLQAPSSKSSNKIREGFIGSLVVCPPMPKSLKKLSSQTSIWA